MYNYSTCYTNRVLTRLVRRVRVYAFSALTTRLCVQCTSKALTNQGGGASVYRLRSLLYIIDSYYYLNEHTILYVFRAPRSNSLVLLSQYEQLALRHCLYTRLFTTILPSSNLKIPTSASYYASYIQGLISSYRRQFI